MNTIRVPRDLVERAWNVIKDLPESVELDDGTIVLFPKQLAIDLGYALARGEQYRKYHEEVVEACAKLLGEERRRFFDTQCTFEEEFLNGEKPSDVAFNQWEAIG